MIKDTSKIRYACEMVESGRVTVSEAYDYCMKDFGTYSHSDIADIMKSIIKAYDNLQKRYGNMTSKAIKY